MVTGLSSLSLEAPLLAFASVLAGSMGIPVPAFAGLILVGSLLNHWHGSLWLPVASFACAIAGAAHTAKIVARIKNFICVSSQTEP